MRKQLKISKEITLKQINKINYLNLLNLIINVHKSERVVSSNLLNELNISKNLLNDQLDLLRCKINLK